MCSSDKPTDDNDVTRRLRDLDAHLNRIIAADRDNPVHVAAYRQTTLCRAAGMTRKGRLMARITELIVIGMSIVKLVLLAVGAFAMLGAVSLAISSRSVKPIVSSIAQHGEAGSKQRRGSS
jgi:hypothetical protein